MYEVFEVEDEILKRVQNDKILFSKKYFELEKDVETGIKTLTLRNWLSGALKRF